MRCVENGDASAAFAHPAKAAGMMTSVNAALPLLSISAPER